jgi:ankyrin repeat protein
VRTLLEYGAELEKELGASKEKKTPLMLAAATGNLDIVRLLITNGAKVEARGNPALGLVSLRFRISMPQYISYKFRSYFPS